MKTPKQLTPKAKQQQATPNSGGRIKKANKKASPQKNTPQMTTTPSSAFKAMMKQKTPKSDGIPQSNGQTPGKKGLKTPKLQGKVIKKEDVQTPGKTIALANNVQNKTASAQKQKQQVKTEKRAQSPGDETPESTPSKQAKTSPRPKKEGQPKRVRSVEKRLELRQLKRQNKKNVLVKLKSADPATLEEDAAKFEARLAAFRGRSNLSKSAQRTVRRYKKYLKVIESVKAGGENVSDLNKSALEHLNSMKKAKPKKQQGESVKNEIGSSKKKKKQGKYEVLVKNLPFDVETGAILLHFEEAGEVLKITMPPGKKGIAYVEFPDEETCQEALKLNQSSVKGREINVSRRGAPGGAKKSPKKT